MIGRLNGIGRVLLDRPPRENLRAVARRFGWAADANEAGPRARGFVASSLIAETAPPGAEDWYQAATGARLPVSPAYRYGVKPAWRNFASLSALAQLERRGLLDEKERAMLHGFIGTRTITRPLAEIDAAAAPILARHEAAFIPETLVPGRFPAAQPEPGEVKASVAAHAQSYRRTFDRLARDQVHRPRARPRALEVGAGSGHASAALASLGYAVAALDSDYDGTMDSGRAAARATAALTGAQVEFAAHDITRRTPFPEGSFDAIVSNSVLEHIPDIPSAFAEMRRLIDDEGVLVHRYNPYFAYNGGHAYGTLDAPWGHARLDAGEIPAYLDRFRPHESAVARPWIESALTRAWPIARMQAALTAAGFAIREWQEVPAPPARLAELSADVVRECLAVNPGISLADLIAVDVAFVATPRS